MKLSVRYVSGRQLPDKAIDLIDEACSRVRMHAMTPPDTLKEAEDSLSALQAQKDEAVRAQNYEQAAKLRDEESHKKEEIESCARFGTKPRQPLRVQSHQRTLQRSLRAGPGFRQHG